MVNEGSQKSTLKISIDLIVPPLFGLEYELIIHKIQLLENYKLKIVNRFPNVLSKRIKNS